MDRYAYTQNNPVSFNDPSGLTMVGAMQNNGHGNFSYCMFCQGWAEDTTFTYLGTLVTTGTLKFGYPISPATPDQDGKYKFTEGVILVPYQSVTPFLSSVTTTARFLIDGGLRNRNPTTKEMKSYAVHFACKNSPQDRVLASAESGALIGAFRVAIVGTLTGSFAAGVGAVPGAIIGGFIGGVTGAAGGVLKGAFVAGVCSALGGYPSN